MDMEITLHKHAGTHPNIIEFYANGEDAIWRWIAMELAEGGDLFDKIGTSNVPFVLSLGSNRTYNWDTEADAGVSEDIAHFYFTQLIAGVTYLHGKGISHRGLSDYLGT